MRSKATTSTSIGRWLEMQPQVDQCGGGVFDRRPALIEPARVEKLVHERLRHRLAGFGVEREAAQHLRLLDPMLVKLRGKLDEVAGDMGSGNARIGDVRENPVQSVAEFMKERPRFVDAHQARLALGSLGEIHHIDHDRQLRAIEFLLAAETAHPCAAAL